MQAQSLTPQVIASGGTSFVAGGYTLDFTVGEPATATLSGGSNLLTQGFHQPESAGALCAVKIWLEGPFNGTNMTNNLQSVLPLAQPFNTAPWNYVGTENIANIPVTATDWILLELRTTSGSNVGGTLVAQRAALLHTDGTIHDTNGASAVTFNGVPAGSYYIAVKPRGNLAVLSANAVVLPNNNSPYDFTTGIAMAYGMNQQKVISGQAVSLTGDANNDGVISVADYNHFQSELAGGINVYRTSDFNKDRQVTVADFNVYALNTSVIGIPAIRY